MEDERISFNLEDLSRNFGCSEANSMATEIISTFYEVLRKSLDHEGNRSIEIRYNDWRISCGELFNSDELNYEIKEEIRSIFGIEVKGPKEYLIFLFSLHTYAAMIYRSLLLKFLLTRLDIENEEKHEENDHLHHLLKSLLCAPEEVSKRIQGLFEESHFTWILAPSVFDSTDRGFIDEMSDFSKKISLIEFPSKLSEEDIFRKLFHELIPGKLRKSLGEFHTPHWLVKRTVEASGFTGEKGEKALDPTCGSGTFIRELIRLKLLRMENTEGTLDEIIETIKGYELNPLSALIAKSNYLMSLETLLQTIIDGGTKVKIPVYQCDSIVLPMQQVKMEKSGVIDIMMWEKEGVKLSKETVLNPSGDNIRAESDIQRLTSNLGQNDVDFTIQICRSKIAPLDIFKADYVVGNPPWINWKNMSTDLKERTGDIWRSYGLFEFERGYDLSTAGDDLAMAVTYVAADKYLTSTGRLSFILPRAFLQSSKGGRGFRKWKIQRPPLLPDIDPSLQKVSELKKHLKRKGCYPIEAKKDALVKQYNRELKEQKDTRLEKDDIEGSETFLRVLNIIDLSGSPRLPKIPPVNPWPGGSVPCMILNLKKGEETTYPVAIKKLVESASESPNDESSRQFEEFEWAGTPSDRNDRLSQWYVAPTVEVRDFRGYSASLGMNKSSHKPVKGWEPAGAKGIHLLNKESMVRANNNTLEVSNDPRRSKPPRPKEERGLVEADLVYPTISGSDITVWKLKSIRNFALIPHLESMTENLSIVPLNHMEENFPKALAWLKRFESGNEVERTLSKRKLKGHKSLRRKPDLLKTMEVPWYSVDNIHPKTRGNHTWKPFKVVYNEQGEFGSCVISKWECSIFPDGKIILPDSKTFLIGFDEEAPANFVAGVLNAPFVRRIVHRFTGELTRGSEVFKLLNPPDFDGSNALHQEISELSKQIHIKAEKEQNYEQDEEFLDNKVRRLYGI